nr:MAG TPA: hypothetical protein [Caudoviricetes sp.]
METLLFSTFIFLLSSKVRKKVRNFIKCLTYITQKVKMKT